MDPTLILFGRDHNGPHWPLRYRATPFWKFQKILKNHRSRISKFWSIIFCVCVFCVLEKNSTRFEQNSRRRYILKFAPMAIPAMALLQQHDARRIFQLNRGRGVVLRSKLAGIRNWGRSELGAQSGRKNPPACFFYCRVCYVPIFSLMWATLSELNWLIYWLSSEVNKWIWNCEPKDLANVSLL